MISTGETCSVSSTALRFKYAYMIHFCVMIDTVSIDSFLTTGNQLVCWVLRFCYSCLPLETDPHLSHAFLLQSGRYFSQDALFNANVADGGSGGKGEGRGSKQKDFLKIFKKNP